MTGVDLADWRERNQVTQVELARLLDLSDRTIRNYESGRSAIPNRIALALVAIEEHPRMLPVGPRRRKLRAPTGRSPG